MHTLVERGGRGAGSQTKVLCENKKAVEFSHRKFFHSYVADKAGLIRIMTSLEQHFNAVPLKSLFRRNSVSASFVVSEKPSSYPGPNVREKSRKIQIK